MFVISDFTLFFLENPLFWKSVFDVIILLNSLIGDVVLAMMELKNKWSDQFIKKITYDAGIAGASGYDILTALAKFYGIRSVSPQPEEERLWERLRYVIYSNHELIPEKDKKPDKLKADLILKNLNEPLDIKSVAVDERARFNKYSEVENECLNIMLGLLRYYGADIGKDSSNDKFLATLANSFIKNTHDARAELLKKYALDKIKDNTQSLKIEFLDTFKDEQ